MSKSIVLTVDVEASPARVYQILTTTQGQSAFWTADCDVYADHARFGFPGEATVEVDITTQPERLVRMHATSGVTHGGTWEYELHPADEGTTVLFRDLGFPEQSPDLDLGRTAQTWARIMDRLVSYVATGKPQPYFLSPKETPMTPGTITKDILINAPAEIVYRVITRPDQIVRWFADAADLDPVPGGRGSLTFADRATSQPMTVKLTVTAAEPPNRLAFHWGYPEGGQPAEGNSTLVEFALTAEGGSTRLRLTESGITALRRPDQDKAAYYEALDKGWDTHLASLQDYAAGQS